MTMKEWISKEEKELVDQLRVKVWDGLTSEELEQLKDASTVDAYFLRWLRARDLNFEKAHHMLITNLKWRTENNVDQVLKHELDPFFKKTFRYAVAGVDYGGHPVFICPFFEWDLRKMLAADKAGGFDTFTQYFLEDVLAKIREQNNNRSPGQAPITQFHGVLDLSGYAYGQLFNIGAIKKWLSFAAAYEAYYPEILFRASIVNCPKIFDLFLNMLQGVVAPRTLSKFVCYRTMADWQKDVATLMDTTILPEQFGGTCKYNPFNESDEIINRS